MAEHQGPNRRAACSVVVGGQNVTDRLKPYLISVKVINQTEGGVSECHLELDDRNAELAIPPDGENIAVALGWSGEGPRIPGERAPSSPQERAMELDWGGPGMRVVFHGVVSKAESGFSRRGGGRRLWIDGTSADLKNKGKEIQQGSHGEGQRDDSQATQTSAGGGGGGAGGGGAGGGGGGAGGGAGGQIPLMTVMQDMAGRAGLTAKLSPAMMKITRDFWHFNESAHHFGQRMARELGGRFSVNGGVMSLVGSNEGVNADGVALGSIDAVWGVNLIGWRIHPFSARAQYGQAQAKFFDLHKANWQVIGQAIGGSTPFGASSAIANILNPVANQTNGQQGNQGTTADSEGNRGNGWVIINGDPRAQAGTRITIKGARPGVDGSYMMTEVEHNYQRGVGFTTRANLSHPILNAAHFPGWIQRGTPEKPKKDPVEGLFPPEPSSVEQPPVKEPPEEGAA